MIVNLLSIFYPKHCALCESPGDYLCADCQQELPVNHNACSTCALPLEIDHQGQCGECLKKAPIWQSAHSLWRYEADAQWLIQHYKYAKAYYLDQSFSQLMYSYADTRLKGQFDAVVAVPMHKRRRVSRGFNQAEILAGSVAEALDVPFIQYGIERTKNTPRFAEGQDKQTRKKAIKGAFSVKTHLPARLLVVDDVKTTGATSEELGRALLQAGAREVSVFVLARTA